MNPVEKTVTKHTADPNARNSFTYAGVLEIVNPRLLVSDIPWQRGSAFNTEESNPTTRQHLGEDSKAERLTIFTLLCGDHENSQRECLKALLGSTNPQQTDIRIAKINVSPETDRLVSESGATKVYTYDRPIGKYRIMRDMFWDATHPITTEYLVWLDDNAFIRDGKWIRAMLNLKKKQKEKVGMFGPRMVYTADAPAMKNMQKWCSAAPWFRNRHWQTPTGGLAPNGHCIHYCASWFFMLSTEAMRTADIPDPRLHHKLGDIVIGAQLHQNDYKLKDANSQKTLVYTPPSKHGVQREKPDHTPW